MSFKTFFKNVAENPADFDCVFEIPLLSIAYFIYGQAFNCPRCNNLLAYKTGKGNPKYCFRCFLKLNWKGVK